jgi:hypothetical protein
VSSSVGVSESVVGIALVIAEVVFSAALAVVVVVVVVVGIVVAVLSVRHEWHRRNKSRVTPHANHVLYPASSSSTMSIVTIRVRPIHYKKNH